MMSMCVTVTDEIVAGKYAVTVITERELQVPQFWEHHFANYVRRRVIWMIMDLFMCVFLLLFVH